MEPHGGAECWLHNPHWQMQTQIFPLTATDASRYVLSFPPWFNSVTATGHHLLICVFVRALYGLILSNPLRKTLLLRARVCACVCGLIGPECQRWVCGVCSSLLSRELSTRGSHWRPACARSVVIAPVPRASCLSSQIRDTSGTAVVKAPTNTSIQTEARSPSQGITAHFLFFL